MSLVIIAKSLLCCPSLLLLAPLGFVAIVSASAPPSSLTYWISILANSEWSVYTFRASNIFSSCSWNCALIWLAWLNWKNPFRFILYTIQWARLLCCTHIVENKWIYLNLCNTACLSSPLSSPSLPPLPRPTPRRPFLHGANQNCVFWSEFLKSLEQQLVPWCLAAAEVKAAPSRSPCWLQVRGLCGAASHRSRHDKH